MVKTEEELFKSFDLSLNRQFLMLPKNTQKVNQFEFVAFTGTEGHTSKGSTATEQEKERWDLLRL